MLFSAELFGFLWTLEISEWVTECFAEFINTFRVLYFMQLKYGVIVKIRISVIGLFPL